MPVSTLAFSTVDVERVKIPVEEPPVSTRESFVLVVIVFGTLVDAALFCADAPVLAVQLPRAAAALGLEIMTLPT